MGQPGTDRYANISDEPVCGMDMASVFEAGHVEFDHQYAAAHGIASLFRKCTVHTIAMEKLLYKAAILKYQMSEAQLSDHWNNSQGDIPRLYIMLLEITMPPTLRTNVKGGGSELSTGMHIGVYQIGNAKPECKVLKEYEQVLDAIMVLVQTKYQGRKFTTVQLNQDLTAKPHVDRNTVGFSIIMTLGPVTGAEF